MNEKSFDPKISHKVPLFIDVKKPTKKSNLTRSFMSSKESSPKFCSVLVIDNRDNSIQINNNYTIKKSQSQNAETQTTNNTLTPIIKPYSRKGRNQLANIPYHTVKPKISISKLDKRCSSVILILNAAKRIFRRAHVEGKSWIAKDELIRILLDIDTDEDGKLIIV